MSNYLSAYTLSMFDTVETGRTKVNYLLTGDTSPFALFSGSPENFPYLSVYRLDFNNQNEIVFYPNTAYSANSPFNLILNGGGNKINTLATTSPDGGYNVVSGVNNKLEQQSGNPTISRNNIVVGSDNIDFYTRYSFTNGIDNMIGSVSSKESENISIISSQSSNVYFTDFSSAISSYNSSIQNSNGAYSSKNKFNFISGKQNEIEDRTFFNQGIRRSFIGNGYKNSIYVKGINSTNYYSSNSIINGQNNNLDTYSVYSYGKHNIHLFGSNLNSVEINTSQFENLYVDETLFAGDIYDIIRPSNTAITIDIDYSFHNIVIEDLSSLNEIGILIPKSSKDLQVLSIIITTVSNNLDNIYFVDWNESANFPTRKSVNPRQIAAKRGKEYNVINNNFRITSLDTDESVAYFFIWIDVLDKWVMYTSDNWWSATF